MHKFCTYVTVSCKWLCNSQGLFQTCTYNCVSSKHLVIVCVDQGSLVVWPWRGVKQDAGEAQRLGTQGQ